MIRFNIIGGRKEQPYDFELDCFLEVVDGVLRLYCKPTGTSVIPTAVVGITDFKGQLVRYTDLPKELGFDLDELGRIK